MTFPSLGKEIRYLEEIYDRVPVPTYVSSDFK